MDVILSPETIDRQACDVLVAGLFLDERPLSGGAGWIDWRLNGRISRFLMENRITGARNEKILIPSQGRVRSSLILLLGMGKVKEYGSLMLRQLSPHLLSTLRGLQAADVCVCLPSGEDYNVDAGKAAEVFIEAVADSLGQESSLAEEEWIMRLRLFFAEGEERLPEILFGVQTAQSIVEEKLPFRILSPQESASGVTLGR